MASRFTKFGHHSQHIWRERQASPTDLGSFPFVSPQYQLPSCPCSQYLFCTIQFCLYTSVTTCETPTVFPAVHTAFSTAQVRPPRTHICQKPDLLHIKLMGFCDSRLLYRLNQFKIILWLCFKSVYQVFLWFSSLPEFKTHTYKCISITSGSFPEELCLKPNRSHSWVSLSPCSSRSGALI